jgi:hypothetical protein
MSVHSVVGWALARHCKVSGLVGYSVRRLY